MCLQLLGGQQSLPETPQSEISGLRSNVPSQLAGCKATIRCDLVSPLTKQLLHPLGLYSGRYEEGLHLEG